MCLLERHRSNHRRPHCWPNTLVAVTAVTLLPEPDLVGTEVSVAAGTEVLMAVGMASNIGPEDVGWDGHMISTFGTRPFDAFALT